MKQRINFIYKLYNQILRFKIKHIFLVFFYSSCIFYFGFVFGNLFSVVLNFFKNKIIWEGTVLVIIIMFFEFLNYLIYNSNNFNNKKLLINYQIGFLLGLFIDAFKVGS